MSLVCWKCCRRLKENSLDCDEWKAFQMQIVHFIKMEKMLAHFNIYEMS